MTMTVVVALVLVMVPSDVWAQTWTRSAEVSFVSMSGNTETRTIGVAGELEHTGRRWESLAQVDYRESATDDVLSARAFSADVRLSTQIADASPIGEYLETYVLVGYTTDTFAGIDDRVAQEWGLASILGRTSAHVVELSLAVGGIHEVRLEADNRTFVTANAGIGYDWIFSSTNALKNELTVTQNMQRADDWRLTNDLSVTAELNPPLSIRLSQRVSFLNSPVPGFGKTDMVVSAGLVASF